eukprot:CAMPEP_0183709908 /NCGR_PEP_ID=MMETSP0737-20130205/5850_1 /TAXON_ID=385413 /ORGANISM="Thalassiosira miniscula, Strain CCMP1093" /LENGTH=196 /DNA_ID=CAMNT_0025938125 /DNA_START=8 /DNA_END=595 /DNA_ORIENTATION=-
MAITRSQSNKQNKRRRTSTSGLNISDLPDALLIAVAEFLPKTLVALFSSVFSTVKSGLPSATSKAIVSFFRETKYDEPWEVLDFLDVEKSLRVKLTDDDISEVLKCTDAKNKLKTLKLTHCFQVSGRGLELLRGSAVLEQLDLSLVGLHEPPELIFFNGMRVLSPHISEEYALPILDSLIENDCSLLMQMQFPQKW